MTASDKPIPWYGSRKNVICFVAVLLIEVFFILENPHWFKKGTDPFFSLVLNFLVATAVFLIPSQPFFFVFIKWLLYPISLFLLMLFGLIWEETMLVPWFFLAFLFVLAYLSFCWEMIKPLFSNKHSGSFVDPDLVELRKSEKVNIGVAIVLIMAAALYRFLVHSKLEQTAALFVGIPALIAVGLSLIPVKNKSGLAIKWTLVAMIASGIFLQEGLVCILMATPIFMGLAGGIAEGLDRTDSSAKMKSYIILLLLPMTFEGTTDFLSFDRNETVVVEREVALTEKQIEWRLANTPFIEKPLPLFLQLGFPVPTQLNGTGLKVGDQRRVWFEGSKRSGELVMELEKRGDNFVLFKKIKDDSHISHWMAWQSNRTEWKKTSHGTHVVTTTIKFRRELDPYWYFAPLERFAVGLVGEHFLETYLG